jgi:hypothetical protein
MGKHVAVRIMDWRNRNNSIQCNANFWNFDDNINIKNIRHRVRINPHPRLDWNFNCC